MGLGLRVSLGGLQMGSDGPGRSRLLMEEALPAEVASSLEGKRSDHGS